MQARSAAGPLLAAVLVVAVLPAGRAAAQAAAAAGAALAPATTLGAEWQPPSALKWKHKALGKGLSAAIALDAEGRTHVAYVNRAPSASGLTHAVNDGKTWTSEVIDDEAFILPDVALAFDAEGGLHLAYGVQQGPTSILRYAHDDGGGWQIETLEDGGSAVSLVLDDAGSVHILDIEGSGVTQDVRYLVQTPTGWEGETIASGGLYFGRSSLVLRDGKVYATFSVQAASTQLVFGVRDGAGWDADVIDTGRSGSLAFDAAGVPHVAYNSELNLELRHAWLGPGGWEHEALITSSSFFGVGLPDEVHAVGDSPVLLADSAGRLQLAAELTFVKGEAAVTRAFLASRDGSLWLPYLIKGKVGTPWSMAVDANDILHLALRRGLNELPRVDAAILKGAKLTVAVAPPESGTVSVAPGGLESTSKESAKLYPGTVVTLTAVAQPGFVFSHWSGAGDGVEPVCEVTLDKARKVKAHFVSEAP
ncbi:MAG TPA: hypothetical protein VFY71_16990 [Planctomycetota bacterium]|nr:hypothetical protein [Planctomycetota bacterium]